MADVRHVNGLLKLRDWAVCGVKCLTDEQKRLRSQYSDAEIHRVSIHDAMIIMAGDEI